MDFSEFVACVAESGDDADRLADLLRQRGISDEEYLSHSIRLRWTLEKAGANIHGVLPFPSPVDSLDDPFNRLHELLEAENADDPGILRSRLEAAGFSREELRRLLQDNRRRLTFDEIIRLLRACTSPSGSHGPNSAVMQLGARLRKARKQRESGQQPPAAPPSEEV